MRPKIFPVSELAEIFLIAFEIPAHLLERVPPELLAHRTSEHDGQHRFADDTTGRNGRDVAALPLRSMRLVRLDVYGWKTAAQRGDGLHEYANEDILPIRH